jgi:hypothetical protein
VPKITFTKKIIIIGVVGAASRNKAEHSHICHNIFRSLPHMFYYSKWL